MLNRPIDKKLASTLMKKFFEINAAKKFNKNSLSILEKKQKLILIETDKLSIDNKDEIKSDIGGYLIQEKNKIIIKKNNLKCVS